MINRRIVLAVVTVCCLLLSACGSRASLAWMMCKRPWIVPIPGTTKKERMLENAGAAEIILTEKEALDIDRALDDMDFEVYGVRKYPRKMRCSSGRTAWIRNRSRHGSGRLDGRCRGVLGRTARGRKVKEVL